MQPQREFQDGELIPGTRYRVVGMLGQGGMGRVYDVIHVELEKRFVLKVLMGELVQRHDLAARLRTEWRALGQLEHPNIVTVTDAGTTATGVPFYVMERLEGETLAARLRQERQLGLGTSMRIMLGVLQGLGAAHQIGIVHRDVKPPNVFLTAGGGVKLLDFGIAKIRDSKEASVTSRGCAIGTPRYMSPEQARGEHVDGRADLYAAGLILFEMIAGQYPFEKLRDPHELLMAHMVREAPKLSERVPQVPPELDQLVACLLAKDPRGRPPTAQSAADALRRIAELGAGEVPAAIPTGSAAETRTLVYFPAVTLKPADDTTQPDPMDAQLTPAAVERDPSTCVRHGALYSPSTADTVLMVGSPLANAPETPPTGPAELGSQATVRLGELDREQPTCPMALEETRTQVPVAELPISPTPPPVVPLAIATPLRRRQRWTRWAGLAAVAGLSFGVAASSLMLLRIRWGGSAEPSTLAPTLAPTPVFVATVQSVVQAPPEPLPLPSRAPALPSGSVSPDGSAKPEAIRPRRVTRVDVDPDQPGLLPHASRPKLP